MQTFIGLRSYHDILYNVLGYHQCAASPCVQTDVRAGIVAVIVKMAPTQDSTALVAELQKLGVTEDELKGKRRKCRLHLCWCLPTGLTRVAAAVWSRVLLR